MSGNYNFNRMHVQEMDMEIVDIPDDDVAKLMYYLSCVDTVINYQGIDRLSDYQNYDSLSVDELILLFKLVLIFNPKYFVEKGVFIIDENLLPDNLSNQFYKITDERIGIHINNEIFIGGRTVNVLKVMACNEDWLIQYYFTPWKNIFEAADRMQRYKQIEVPPPPPQEIVYVDRPTCVRDEKPKNYVPPPKEKDNCGCTCILF